MSFEVALPLFLFLMGLGWFVMANYISLILHRGVAHRAVLFPRWWVYSIMSIANAFFIYINPRTWVADHRMHHAYSDTEKDPDKHPEDKFWKWFVRFLKHNPSAGEDDILRFSKDDIFETKIVRFHSGKWGGLMCQLMGILLPSLLFWSVYWGVLFWVCIRVSIISVLSLQSYFAHSSHLNFGHRTYELNDNSANLTNPVALFLTAGECLQNNHHAKPRNASHSHSEKEWDPGFMLVRLLVFLKIATIVEW